MSRALQNLVRALLRLPPEVLRLLLLLLFFLLWLIWALLRFLFGKDRPWPPKRHCECPGKVPDHVRRRPDPCLYSQSYLQQQGIPVTWNNPDIWLTETDGTPVDSSSLQPAHPYQVWGRISNASFDAALGVSVRCRFREWGVNAAQDTPVELTPNGFEAVRFLNILPFGAAVATFNWTTPAAPGHYCLFVACAHPDDLNNANNVGQENTDVIAVAAGGTAKIHLPVFNPTRFAMRLRFAFDTYRIPDQEWRVPLEGERVAFGRFPATFGETRKPGRRTDTVRWLLGAGRPGLAFNRWRYRAKNELYEQQRSARTPLPAQWRVELDGADHAGEFVLAPRESRVVDITIAVPASARAGTRVPVNIAAWAPAHGPLGGVTVEIGVE